MFSKSFIQKVCSILAISVILTVIYFLATSLRKERLKNIEFIKSNYKITKGIITGKHSYKGNSIHIRYIVDGKIYEEIDGYDEKFIFKEGDSVTIKYSKSMPDLMISEFNEDYNN
ncbi:hypothetical protein ACSVH2_01310 [Flavobacterium sp. RSB2_4_14]|uniref:hypothetical protein n=1 Tax=Flavobacterium sp. RSB2_4_14 TaxID=3447665 RepID=UPI003F349483